MVAGYVWRRVWEEGVAAEKAVWTWVLGVEVVSRWFELVLVACRFSDCAGDTPGFVIFLDFFLLLCLEGKREKR